MKRFILPLLALLVQGALQADPVEKVPEPSARLDPPGAWGPFEAVELKMVVPSDKGVLTPGPLWRESTDDMLEEKNPAISYRAFAEQVDAVGRLREKRQISEEEFLRMAAEPDTIVLDARSQDKFDGVHIKGAVNLPLPDMNSEDLARVIPSKTTRVLIYCNNNFEDLSTRKREVARSWAPATPESASLNIYTFNTLHAYGYSNVYELGPLIEIQNSILPFEGRSLLPK